MAFDPATNTFHPESGKTTQVLKPDKGCRLCTELKSVVS